MSVPQGFFFSCVGTKNHQELCGNQLSSGKDYELLGILIDQK